MKWAQAGVILRARLSQANVAADNADNIGLLLETLREVVGECHELGRNPNGVAGNSQHHTLKEYSPAQLHGEDVGNNGPVENLGYFLSCASCLAISASSRGFSSARTLSTIFESASLPAGLCDVGDASDIAGADGASFWEDTAASAITAADSAIASVARSVITVSRIRCQLSQAAEDSDSAGGSEFDVVALTASA